MGIDHIIVHDTRLRGTVHPRSNTRIIRTHCEPLSAITARITRATRRQSRPTMANQAATHDGPVPVISLLGHGTDIATGPVAWAMQIGMEYIHQDNARAFGSGIRRCVSNRIRVLCCNGANSADARQACSELAVSAGVNVFAATTVQQYHQIGTGSQLNGPMGGWINFGRWEGTVVRYGPDGSETIAFEGDPLIETSGTTNGPDVTDPYQVSC
ncbi:hypothetical protein ACJ5NV_05220 [Loktanella agnita]|uniref:hypothetical protein n=1 Tax=Loktanella agnita TaxID=287097 RepID=UPI0039885EE3